MSKPIQAYVHKGCKTCKRATDYLEERKIAFEPIELFEARLTAHEIRTLLRKLSLAARELLRPRDRMYRELDLRNGEIPEDELIQLMVENPGLIKRPILVRGDRAVLGIKPELVHEIER
ncbi:MAG: Spx/MgsR family RNA polymerase-binding regulatory protein [Candidatus Thermoplasmatota archaeon]|nr:Spx/MgsR family RNA polymerase-binding regulatory protein [Candidatus Thermoplasmatota archaeon]